MHLFSEHRLIHRTLASVEEQRKAAGLAPLATPVGTSPTSSTANAQAQQQQYSQKLATAQAGSAQVKAATDANFAAKQTIGNLSSLYDASGNFSGTSDQMAQLNDAQGKFDYTNKTLGAQTSIAQNAANGSGQKTLDALALGGQQQSYDPSTGITQLSGKGGLEQSAIDTLRKNGLNDQQISAKLNDPEYMKSISTTMSNTGLNNGTARQSAVLTTAQAQNIIATSRNPKERAEAQKLIDEQVNNVKGYDQVPQYNKDGQITGYSNVENSAKTQENQQAEKNRLAQEEANRLAMQKQQDDLKKFTAGVDPAPVEQTKTQIDSLLASVSNLSPDLQAAVLPSLISLQQSNNDITKEVNNIIGSQPTDQEIQAQYGSLEKYIQSEDAKYKALLDRNMETSKEVATYNRDMLEADKAIIDHDASIAEQKQMIANTEGEKQLRRQLNRLGIQTDVQGLNSLQNEVQKGVDALENLKTANNLVSLKAQLAIGEGYRLDVKQAMETYEGNYLNITSQTTDRLNAIKNSISTAKADRNKEIKEARRWGLEQKMANDKELRTTIADANNTMNDNVNKLRDDERAQETLGYQRLQSAVSTYGTNVPQAMIDSISKMLPGVDVKSIIATPTAAALKKAGGGGSAGTSYGAYNGGVTGTANNFTNLNPQQLTDAVNRIFAPANFGGTAGERTDKVNTYLKRISSGEDIGNIAASLQGDYWASQKGAPRTAHDERTTAQGSMEALQSFADFYSISGEDDGPLGFLDSKVEGFKSIFKQSSDEYNNLAGQVGNIRAKIIKDNYGSAVTPQELSIARSYIPDMTDGGAQFVTKLQNLKAYNAYLDAKVFASTTGLPAPSPPLPVKLTGDKMSGAGKYSNEDMASFLYQ